MKTFISDVPVCVGGFDIDLPEMMYYLYLPVRMDLNGEVRLPKNLFMPCYRMVRAAIANAPEFAYRYVYVSARKGWASPDNPLNRPGWHCDGFGTDDLNYVWWSGASTRFVVQRFTDISDDHVVSLRQFEAQIRPECIYSPEGRRLYRLDSSIVHATPLIDPPGCMRQFVKISMSNHRYNLADNSHNYLFDYDWPMIDRHMIRNDPAGAGKDFYEERAT